MDEVGKSLEPFYGRDYCLKVTMDLEKLRDELFQGNCFLFKKGWLEHTVELLIRLQHLGFPIRTKDHVLIHLSPPVEKMAFGELYFQVGRQLPGSLSLKFTRRQPDNTMVIQPTVLEQEEERRLALDPCRYFEELRTTARSSISPSDAQRMLTTIIVLSNKCERQRLNVNSFFQRLSEKVNSLLPQLHHPLRYCSDLRTEGQALSEYPISIPASYSTPLRNESGPQRSRSEGNIIRFGSPAERFKGPHQRHTEPEENDENNEVSGQDQELFRQWSVPTEEYAGTTQGIVGFSPRRSSNDSTGRTSLQDEYAGINTALAALTVSREPFSYSNQKRNQRGCNPVMAGLVSEEYASTSSVFREATWNSHEDSDSHTGYRQAYLSAGSHETFLPVPVEEMNNAAARIKD